MHFAFIYGPGAVCLCVPLLTHNSIFSLTPSHFGLVWRKMPDRIGHLIKDLSLDDVPLHRQGCPTGEVMCIWALCGFIHLPVTALDQKETRKSYCSMPDTNTHALLHSWWCVQWGCDTAAVSFSESENVMLASWGSSSVCGLVCNVLHWCCLPCNLGNLLDVSEIHSQFSHYFNF